MTNSHVGSVNEELFQYEKWRKQAIDLAKTYNQMWKKSYKPFMEKYPNSFLIVKYEDLIVKETGIPVLKNWLKFMGEPFSEDKVKCAVVLSRHPQVRRVLSPNAMKKPDAYADDALVCKIWEIVRETAAPAGYNIWRNTSCVDVDTSVIV